MNKPLHHYLLTILLSFQAVLLGLDPIEPSLPLLDRGSQEALSIIQQPDYQSDVGRWVFKGLKYEDYLPFLAQRVLVLDADASLVHAAILDSTLTVDQLEAVSISEATLEDFRQNGVSSLPFVHDYRLIIKALDSTALEYPQQLEETDGIATYGEHRTKLLLRGAIGLQHLHDTIINYPVVAIELSNIPSAVLQMDMNSPELILKIPSTSDRGAFGQAVITYLKDQDISAATVFVGGPTTDVITKLADGYEDVLDRQTALFLGGLHTATTLYRLLPEQEVLFSQQPNELTYDKTVQRYLKYAHELGKGLLSFQENHLEPIRMRYWYWPQVFRLGHLGIAAQQCWSVVDAWLHDHHTMLLVPEWTHAKQQEWMASNRTVSFMEWLIEDQWDRSGSTDTLDEWTLHKVLHIPKSETSFVEFADSLQELWEAHDQNLTFENYVKLTMRYIRARTAMPFKLWCSFLEFQKQGSPGNFEEFALSHLWKKAIAAESTTLTESEWLQENLRSDYQRWQKQGIQLTGMDFQTYRTIQSQFNWYGTDRPLVALDAPQRIPFRITVDNGHLYRNGKPFATESERTWHNGDGFVIFVMDCYGNLYAASHGSVFFHSSFLADAPVAMAGELKTDAEGKILFISNKSGHYAPDTSAVIRMLKYFESKGVDLSTTDFEEISASSAKQFANALDFLLQVEQGAVAIE